ncbi:MAG: hypothetical protein AAB425_01390, partial [Bdellovibrionota bacterium]
VMVSTTAVFAQDDLSTAPLGTGSIRKQTSHSYGGGKARAEDLLLARLPNAAATVLRLGAVMGLGDFAAAFHVFQRLQCGQPILIGREAPRKLSFVHALDFARHALEASQPVEHCLSSEATDQPGFIKKCEEISGIAAAVRVIGNMNYTDQLAGIPWVEHDIVPDVGIPYATSLRQILSEAWSLAESRSVPVDFPRERRLIRSNQNRVPIDALIEAKVRRLRRELINRFY